MDKQPERQSVDFGNEPNRVNVDWAKPVLAFEELLAITEYSEVTAKRWCQNHRFLCEPINNGKFIIHRDKFLAWIGTSQKSDAVQ